jgi:uncharacterized protein Yka (UPF0111/DUF47 family)
MFFGRQEKFFASLHTQMDLLGAASRLLLEGAREGRSGARIADGIDELRRRVDALYAEIALGLSRTLVTPIDPEDILRLSCLMKRLVEGLARTASRQEFCPCTPAPAELVNELEIIHRCSESLRSAFGSFRNGALARHCDEIGALRTEADRIGRRGRARMFESGLEPVAVLRLRETYDLTEAVLGRYVTASETLKRIKLKNG